MTDSPFHKFQGSSFGGIPMAQYWADLLVWEEVLNQHTDASAIIELGSWLGGFSLFLQAQAQAREMAFRCYDVTVPESFRLDKDFVKLDIFAHWKVVLEHIALFSRPVILFCDNGNKPRELRTFTQELPEGSVVAAHDWGTETLPTDVPDWLEEHMGDYCDEMGSITRFFTVKT